jgi:hypothetical protein
MALAGTRASNGLPRSFDIKQSGHQHYGSEQQHEHRACQLVHFTVHPSSPSPEL